MLLRSVTASVPLFLVTICPHREAHRRPRRGSRAPGVGYVSVRRRGTILGARHSPSRTRVSACTAVGALGQAVRDTHELRLLSRS